MTERGDLGLILGGGGARAAYQVGVLQGIVEEFPDLCPEILNGVSAGAINAAALANRKGGYRERVAVLVELWSQLTVDQVFRSDTSSLLFQALKSAFATLVGGGGKNTEGYRSLVDTTPLRDLLCLALDAPDGSLKGVDENLASTGLKAISLVGTHYATGHSVTWFQGGEPNTWSRMGRHGVRTELTVEHIMASSALPLFFPAVEVDGAYYGDGGIRQHTPLAPAIHLGATRLLSISTRYGNEKTPYPPTEPERYPQPAQILGVLMNAVFLDVLDHDVLVAERVNRLLARAPEIQDRTLRPLRILSLRPSVDLGRLAGEYEPRLPGMFRFLTRRLGTKKADSTDALSMVMFQPDYLQRLIEIGRADALRQRAEIGDLLA